MPEGHTIHRLARDHAAAFAGHRVAASSPQGRFGGATIVDGTTFVAADAWGKHLFHTYDADRIVHVHLGLIGKFFAHPVPPPPPRDTVRYRVIGPTDAVDLVGPNVCELITPDDRDRIVGGLGPDPIRDDADPERAWQALQRRSVGIGRAILDQTVLAGVGNVYRAEVLYVHGLHPEIPSRHIEREQWDAIWATLREWMRRGVRQQRIITVDPREAGKPRSKMTRAEATYVYKADECPRCGDEIRRYDLAGRWAYVCETCQPRPATRA